MIDGVVARLVAIATPGHCADHTAFRASTGALLAGDWATVGAAEQRTLREASGLVSAYLAWHLERGLRSMEHVQR